MDKVTRFTVDPKRFTIQKEMVVRMLRNFKAEQPHQHAFYYTSVLILHPMWTKEELAQALEGEWNGMGTVLLRLEWNGDCVTNILQVGMEWGLLLIYCRLEWNGDCY